MTVKAPTEKKVEATSLARVQALVRAELKYDGETWKTPKSIGRIACFHGTDIESITRLAKDGYFSGGDPRLRGVFFTVPNPLFQGWSKTDLTRDTERRILSAEFDCLQEAIEYSETRSANSLRGPTVDSEQHGVVIAFKGTAIESEATLYEDPSLEKIELVLPRAPELRTIQGIYPVNVLAKNALDQCLEELT